MSWKRKILYVLIVLCCPIMYPIIAYREYKRGSNQ